MRSTARPFGARPAARLAPCFALAALLAHGAPRSAAAGQLVAAGSWHFETLDRERMHSRFFVGGAVPFMFTPEGISSWYSPRPGLALAWVRPMNGWLDGSVGFEFSRLPFRPDAFRGDLGEPENPTDAEVTWITFSARVHADRDGPRPFATAGLLFSEIQAPPVRYTDSNGVPRESPGSNIFGFDPGIEIGGGWEWHETGRWGASLDARVLIIPGRTEPTHASVPVRAGVTIPLPF